MSIIETRSQAAASAATAKDDAAAMREEKAQASTADDAYNYDIDQINAQRRERPWENNPKYFTSCHISALACMKMLKHALSGVDKGRAAGTNPVEVMGLMIGKPQGDSIIVTDACPLPVEGSETRVVADDAQLHIVALLEAVELRRKDGFIGWYHSHPFDVESYSHCHLSAIDVQTQTSWQNNSPTWTAVVIDPLRSLAKQTPELGAFRIFPPKYNPPPNECPDGTIEPDATARTVRWGLTANRYYSLPITYFLSSLGSTLLGTMSRNNLWVRLLSGSEMSGDGQQRTSDRVVKTVDKLNAVDTAGGGISLSTRQSRTSGARGGAGGVSSSMFDIGAAPSAALSGKSSDALRAAARSACEVAIEQCKGHTSQFAKHAIFNIIQRQNAANKDGETSAADDIKMAE